MSDRFKVTSRRVPEWPPHIEGYTLLICFVHDMHESGYYCRTEEAADLSFRLGPHVDALERLLREGKSFEQAVAAILMPSPRVAISGDI